MDAAGPQPFTQVLNRMVAGDSAAASELLPILYGELHALAERMMRDQGGAHTLQPTALIHEAWMKLVGASERSSEAATLATEILRDVGARGISEPQVLAALHQTLGECEFDAGEIEPAACELGDAWRIAEEGAAYASDPYHPHRLALIEALARVEDARGHTAEAAEWRARLPDSGQRR